MSATIDPPPRRREGTGHSARGIALDYEGERQDDQSYDHYSHLTKCATWFDPSDVSDPSRQRKFRRLKSWHDGRRDEDYAHFESQADKTCWAGVYAAKLELPRDVELEATSLVHDLGDLPKLGHYNGVHTAALGCLVVAYKRHWLRKRYRERGSDRGQRWCERADFRRLWEGLGLTEEDVRSLTSLIAKKTSVAY